MVFGYVLIATKNTYEHRVADELSKFNEIVDIEPLLVEETALADPFFEDYDLMVKIKADNAEGIKDFVDDKIHTIHGVEKTVLASRPRL
jgi:DNA-binding Lrp family transcriptional regulator